MKRPTLLVLAFVLSSLLVSSIASAAQFSALLFSKTNGWHHESINDGVIAIRQMCNLSLTLDHRYIDGIAGARFAQALKGYLEDPALMLFWLAELKDLSGDTETEPRD